MDMTAYHHHHHHHHHHHNKPQQQSETKMAEVNLHPKNPIVVVKIGTSTIMREAASPDIKVHQTACGEASANMKTGRTEMAVSTIGLLVDTLLSLRRANYDVILVSSGGVGVGCHELGVPRRPSMPDDATREQRARILASIQAYAAVGQSILMRTYDSLFGMAHQKIAQVLLTSGDLGSEYQYYNAKNTLLSLLDMGVIPIVNENDTTATEEIKYGDNDWLSALVATTIGAKWLFLLTDVDQLCTSNPRINKDAKPIPIVNNIESLLENHNIDIGSKGTQWGTGGMQTKITAARLATAAGVQVGLIHGRHPVRILDFVHDRDKKIGTVFQPLSTPLEMEHKKWISNCLPPRGHITISENATMLLRGGHPLLTLGVEGCKGVFDANSAVSIRTKDGLELARGISNYSSRELIQFMGMNANQIHGVLGFPMNEKVIHEDNLALLVDLDSSCSRSGHDCNGNGHTSANTNGLSTGTNGLSTNGSYTNGSLMNGHGHGH